MVRCSNIEILSNKLPMKRSHIVFLAILCGLIVAVYCGNRLLPYSLGHFKQINAVMLASIIHQWQREGTVPEQLRLFESSNSSLRVFQFRTNVVYKGSNYPSVLALEAGNFRRRGILVGTPAAEVFWLEKDGSTKLILNGRSN